MSVIQKFYPMWRDLKIHESSPGKRGLSTVLTQQCKHYTATQYDPSFPFGQIHADGWRNEDLQSQTFPDSSFDLVITQDVFEHVFKPDKAIAEIARTLRPGGAHICTVPLVQGTKQSRRRASLSNDGNVIYHLPADYHDNPVDPKGSLVTIDWGYDIAHFFNRHARSLTTSLVIIKDSDTGVDGELTEVVLCVKARAPKI